MSFFFSDTAIISSHSLEEKDNGFSTKTLIPISIIFFATAKWVLVGVQTRHASNFLSLLSISSIEWYDLTLYLSAISLDRFSFTSHIATKTPRSLRTLAWFFPHPPTPIIASLR